MNASFAISAIKGTMEIWPEGSPGLLRIEPVIGASPQSAHYMPTLGIVSTSRSRHLWGIAENCLSNAERTRFARFVRLEDRARFVLGRFMAKSMLAEHYGIDLGRCEFAVNTYGKPCLPARPDIVFNIAHSGDLVLVGIGRGLQLGVDVELHKPDAGLEAIAGLVFCVCEREAIFCAQKEHRPRLFFDQWALKEALVKALGTGFALEPRRFAINRQASRFVADFVGPGEDDIGKGWTIVKIDIGDGYSAAAAWRRIEGTHAQEF